MAQTTLRFCFLCLGLMGIFGPVLAHEEDAAREMAQAATRFLSSLDSTQSGLARIGFDEAERENFHFIPRERKGIPLKDLDPAQEALAMSLLSSGLSHLGFAKVNTIVSLEKILYEMTEPRFRRWRDAELYYFSIFGTPGSDQTWGWRFEGHHISLNFSLVEGKHISATPSFLGSNPAIVRQGPHQGMQALEEEQNLGRRLARSLNSEQRDQAFIAGEAPSDIVTGAERNIEPLEPSGIGWPDLTSSQQQQMRELIEVYLYRHRSEIAVQDLARIEEAGWERVHFAWAGGTEPGEGHYYRVQGPTFLLEYDNTQNGANHIHAVYRDFDRDFGRDLLKEHYERSHRHEHP